MDETEQQLELERLEALYPYQFVRVFAYGMSPPPGWIGIFASVCADIDVALEGQRKENFSWIQIKEKFGSLRMHWDRRWTEVDRMPYKTKWYHEIEEFIYPEVIPEDPEFDPKTQTVEEYLDSPRSREWTQLQRIPNPALAQQPRSFERRIGGNIVLTFEDERPSEEDINLAALAVVNALMVSKVVTDRIREITDQAERVAAVTCQRCGSPGEHRVMDGWHAVLCETHLKNREI